MILYFPLMKNEELRMKNDIMWLDWKKSGKE